MLSKKYGSAAVFKYAMLVQAVIAVLFLIGVWQDWYGLAATIAMFFAWLSCLGLIYPNAAVLALAPFSKHAGSASALLGFLQIGVGALSSSTVGLLDAQTTLPIVATLADGNRDWYLHLSSQGSTSCGMTTWAVAVTRLVRQSCATLNSPERKQP